jgi:hypothetical protein
LLLLSKKAVQVNIEIVRAFVQMRRLLAANEDLARKVAEHDRHIANLYDHVGKLMQIPQAKKRPIGFIHPDDTDED